jgi:hypothetical protein
MIEVSQIGNGAVLALSELLEATACGSKVPGGDLKVLMITLDHTALELTPNPPNPRPVWIFTSF